MTALQHGIVLQPMQPDDIDWVAECESEICLFPWSHKNFSDALCAGYSCWLLRCAELRAGYAILMMVADEAHLLNLGVGACLQGRGLGKTLLNQLFDVARDQGAVQMFLEVRPSNEIALNLYRRAGFVQIGRRKGYYPARQGREDALVMRRDL